MIMLKKTKIAFGVVAGIAVAASAVGYWGGQYYVAQKFHETLSNSGYCMKTSEPTYSMNSGVMAVTSDCSDWYGYEWKVVSLLQLDFQNKGVYSQTKLIANSDDTVSAVSQIMNPKTKALRATAFGVHKLQSDHVEVELEPFQFVSEQNSINLPASVVIVDRDHETKKTDVVFAPSEDVSINTLGGITKIVKPRAMWNITDANSYTISVRSESVSVGNVSIAKKPSAVVTQKGHDGVLDLDVKFTADSITNTDDVNFQLQAKNLVPETSVQLFKNATDLVQSVDSVNRTEFTTKVLENVFDLAANNANVKLHLTADDYKPVKTAIDASLSFEKDSKDYINKDNAFSILESLIVDATVMLPASDASMMIDPIWLQNFLSDGLIENNEGQLSTKIQFRDMTANVNGKVINL